MARLYHGASCGGATKGFDPRRASPDDNARLTSHGVGETLSPVAGWTEDRDGPADTLRVLLPAKTSRTPLERALEVVELNGEPWLLEELAQRPAAERNVAYTCVSYSWGTQRRPHVLSPRFTMSDRALAAAECAL